MNVPHPFSALVISAAPEVILILASVIIFSIRSSRRLDDISPLGSFSHLLAVSACLLSIIPAGFYYFILTQVKGGRWIEHSGFRIDGTILPIKITLLLLAVLALILSREEKALPRPVSAPGHDYGLAGSPGLLLLSTAALMIFCSSATLGVAFLGLDFLGLAWGLSWIYRQKAPRVRPAAPGFFIPWALSSSLLLLGYSFLYSASGSSLLRQTTPLLFRLQKYPLWVLAFAMLFIGLVFKFGYLPLRLSKPKLGNRYSPSILAFHAAVILWVSFWILGLFLTTGSSILPGARAPLAAPLGWKIFIALFSASLMIWGSFAALFQRSLCRMILYLALVQTGFLAMTLSFTDYQILPFLTCSGLFHTLSLLGICGFSSILIRATGSDRIESLRSLGRSQPLLGACMVVFLLSWVGLPPLAGFWSKLGAFTLLFKLRDSHLFLPLFLSAVALWAMLLSLWPIYKVLKNLYHSPNHSGLDDFQPLPLKPQATTRGVLLLLALVLLAAGLGRSHCTNLFFP